MDLTGWSSGFNTAWTDATLFFKEVSFARPWVLWLFFIVTILFLVLRTIHRQQTRRLLSIGKLSLLRIRFYRITWRTRLLFSIGLAAFIIGLAGPRWGTRTTSTVARGRDVVLVLDMSRSMRAKDLESTMTRFDSAIDGAYRWIDTVRGKSGHRVAVVVFASHACLWVPLTSDLNYAKTKLKDLDADYPPMATRPTQDDSRSGTRIGAGLSLAVSQLEPVYGGAQDVILFTDGDDPEDDREWIQGINVARSANIPVHVVGLGDPTQAVPLLLRDLDDEIISTKLFEDVTQTIAREGRGVYVPSRRKPVELATLIVASIDQLHTRLLVDDELMEKNDRSAWFYAAAIVCLSAVWTARRSA